MTKSVESSTASLAPINLLNLSATSTPSNNQSNANVITKAVKSALKTAQPLYPYRIFDGLQFGCSHVSSVLPDSLCQLDLMGFIAATVYCILDTGKYIWLRQLFLFPSKHRIISLKTVAMPQID